MSVGLGYTFCKVVLAWPDDRLTLNDLLRLLCEVECAHSVCVGVVAWCPLLDEVFNDQQMSVLSCDVDGSVFKNLSLFVNFLSSSE